MMRAAILGFAHMHVNEIALCLSQQPDFELAAVAEVDSGAGKVPPLRYTPGWNLENIRQNYCDNIYESYTELLDREKIDLAFILCENSMKEAVARACAERGVNVCIEKPMADSFASAKRIQAVARECGIEVVVNWPVAWRAYLHKMKAALDARLVGEPIKMHYVNGHTGPLGKGARHRGVSENAEEMSDDIRAQTWWHRSAYGGGVLLDIGCYGCLLSKWLMGGGEKSVMASGANLNTPFGDTADNFAAIVKYDDRLSVLEGSWTIPRVVIPSGPMVLCSEGALLCTGGAENDPDVKAFDLYGHEVPLPEFAATDALRNMPWHYATHIKQNAPLLDIVTLDRNVEIMAMLDAIRCSARSGKEEAIHD